MHDNHFVIIIAARNMRNRNNYEFYNKGKQASARDKLVQA